VTSDHVVLSQVEVRKLRDAESLVRDRHGELFEVRLDADRLATAFALCDGTRSLDEVIALADVPPEFRTVANVLAGADDHRRGRAAATDLRAAPLTVTGPAEVLAPWREARGFRPAGLGEPVWLEQQDPTAPAGRLVPGSVLVTVHLWRDGELLRRTDEQVAVNGVTWVPVVFDGAKVFLGPVIRPGAVPVYSDVLDRRVAASVDPDVTRALETGPLTAVATAAEADVLWVGAVLAQLLSRLVEGQPCALFGNEVEADLATLRLRHHPVLPMPQRVRGPYRNDLVSGPDLLVDEATGLVAQLGDVPLLPEMPSALTTVVARVGDVRRLGVPWGVNTIAGCSVLAGDRAEIEASAVGESVERYAGNWVQLDRTVVGTYEQMTRRSERVLDPDSVVLYSDAQYATPGFPFVPFRHDTEVRWVLGWSVTGQDPVWIPAGMAWGNYNLGPSESEPPLHPTLYAGLAAGVNLEEAVRGGLEEVLERHAAMAWWSHQATLPRLRPGARLAAQWRTATGDSRLTGWLLHVENRFGLPVIAGVVDDPERQLTTVGFALREDAELCALKAWGEALSNLLWAVDLLEEHGAYWSELHDMHDIRRRGGKLGYLKPWRADRRYLDSFRADFRDVGDLESQLQLTCDTRARERVGAVLRGGGELDLDSLPTPADRSLEGYRRVVEEQGFEILAVDLTTPDVRLADLSVVRVLVPGLVNNFAAAFPLWGKGVLAAEGALLGWRDGVVAEAELNVFPMPHA